MSLHELRKTRAMTQKAVDEVLKVNQPAVAKLERRADMYGNLYQRRNQVFL